MLLIWLVLLLISGPLIWAIRPHRYNFFGWIAALPPAVVTIWLITQMNAVAQGHFIHNQLAWATDLGLELSLRLDGLSLFFGLIITGIGTGIAIYTDYYLEDDPRQGYFYALLFLFMGSMLGLVWADNLIALFVFWEGTSITSYLMVGYSFEDKNATEGARKALIITGLGGLAMLAGLVLLGQYVNSYTITDLLNAEHLTEASIYPAALILILIGAFTKSAQFPFQFWLPGAMAAPTPTSAYLHSATMVKAGIYLLARLHPALSESALWFWLLLIFGGITMLLGTISALRYYDLKRILAYATISQLGIIVMLLAFEDKTAYVAVVVGILGHTLYKGPLFMIAGIIYHATGTRDIRRLAGLWRPMPWVGLTAVMAGLSMAGIPPLLGFLSKETLLEALFHNAEEMLDASGSMVGWIYVGAGAIAGAFFVGYSLTLIIETFLRSNVPSEDPAHVHHAPSVGFFAPPLVITLLGLLLPLIVGFVEDLLFSPPATSIAGEQVDVHLSLWHGFTIVFQASMAAIAAGILIYFLRNPIRRILNAVPENLSGVTAFNQFYASSYTLARSITRLVQGGSLASQASVVLLSAVGVLIYALLRLDLAHGFRVNWFEMPEFQEVAIGLLAVVAAVLTVRAQSRLNAIISIGVVGVTVTLLFVFFGAPDLALTQLLIEVLTVVLLVLVFTKIPPERHPPLRNLVQVRNLIVSAAMGLFGFVLILLNAGDPFAPSISDFFTFNSIPAAHGANIVNVILVDFRGFDTMGEITVLAIAALGGYALLLAVRLRNVKDRYAVDDEE